MDARSDGLPSGGAAAEATIAKTAAEHRSALPKAKLPLEQFPGKLSFARTPGSGLVTRHSYARIAGDLSAGSTAALLPPKVDLANPSHWT